MQKIKLFVLHSSDVVSSLQQCSPACWVTVISSEWHWRSRPSLFSWTTVSECLKKIFWQRGSFEVCFHKLSLILCPQMNIFLYILSSRASCSLRHQSIEKKEPRVWVSQHYQHSLHASCFTETFHSSTFLQALYSGRKFPAWNCKSQKSGRDFPSAFNNSDIKSNRSFWSALKIAQ